jgi:hypothetical protein
MVLDFVIIAGMLTLMRYAQGVSLQARWPTRWPWRRWERPSFGRQYRYHDHAHQQFLQAEKADRFFRRFHGG